MARRQAVLAEFFSDPRWKPLTGRSTGDLWTDDYSNILRVIQVEVIGRLGDDQ
jgi:hypothetical protein